MARPPAYKEGQKQKSFIVSAGFRICDFDGVSKYGGETIMLTQAQAKFYQQMNAITVDMEATFNDKPDDSSAESGSGSKADGGGKPRL